MDLHRSHLVPGPHVQPHAEGWLPAEELLPQVRDTVCVCVHMVVLCVPSLTWQKEVGSLFAPDLSSYLSLKGEWGSLFTLPLPELLQLTQ